MDGVAALRDVVGEARNEAAFRGATTVVFLDEIHRYSKAQQDALLPHVEAGTIVLVGATTEAPFGGRDHPPAPVAAARLPARAARGRGAARDRRSRPRRRRAGARLAG